MEDCYIPWVEVDILLSLASQMFEQQTILVYNVKIIEVSYILHAPPVKGTSNEENVSMSWRHTYGISLLWNWELNGPHHANIMQI